MVLDDVRGYREDANIELMQQGLVARLLTKDVAQVEVHVIALGSFTDIDVRNRHRVK